MSRDVDPSKLGYRPCVGIMVLNARGLVWLGRRADAPGEAEGPGSWWQMPQGGIDKGEDPRKAALRELHEETGIRSVSIIAETPGWLRYELPRDLLGKAWGGKYRGQEQKWFAARFLGSDGEVVITPPAGHQVEFDAWRWVPLSELVDLIVPFKLDVYRQVVEAFAAYAVPQRDISVTGPS
jgi:putative (di)nucleoside polyphosphate hydrolase